MARGLGQKKKLLLLLQYLEKETDDTHAVTMTQILEYLNGEGVTAERKSVYDDIATLQDMGYTIERDCRPKSGYALVERPLEWTEVRLLIDAVEASRFISRKKSRELIAKLGGAFGSRHQEKELKMQRHISGITKTDNEKVYYAVDTLQAAMAADRKVSFEYFHRSPDGRKIHHRNSRYTVSPWLLQWKDENYYLLAYTDDGTRVYRVDRMENVNMEDLRRDGADNPTIEKREEYADVTFGMFGGNRPVKMTVRAGSNMADAFFDRFGRDILLVPDGRDGFTAHVTVVPSVQFYGWLTGLGNTVELVYPEEERRKYAAYLQELLSHY